MTTDVIDYDDLTEFIDPVFAVLAQRGIPVKQATDDNGVAHVFTPLSDLIRAFRYTPPPRVKNPISLLETPKQLMDHRVLSVVCLSSFIATCGLFCEEPAVRQYAIAFTNAFILPGFQIGGAERVELCFSVSAMRQLLAEFYHDSITALRIPGALLEICGSNVVVMPPGQHQLNLF
jgi:hypothetical protein